MDTSRCVQLNETGYVLFVISSTKIHLITIDRVCQTTYASILESE